VGFLQNNPELGAVMTQAQLIDGHSRFIRYCTLPKGLKTPTNIYTFNYLIKALLKYSNFLFTPSAMVKTAVYKQDIKVWQEDLFKSSADLDVWLRIARKNPIGILPEPLFRYRISNTQWTAAVRRSTEKADFFTVMDAYILQPEINAFLGKRDWINYRKLERRDRMMRATNLFLEGKDIQANALCYDAFSSETLRASLTSKRDALTLTLGGMLKVFLYLSLETTGRKFFKGLIVRLKK
jgi:hypothetical protein